MTTTPGENWLTVPQAAALTGYSIVNIRRVARLGLVQTWKPGREYLIERQSLLDYQAQMQALGEQWRNAWRADLTAQGRGRRGRQQQTKLAFEEG